MIRFFLMGFLAFLLTSINVAIAQTWSYEGKDSAIVIQKNDEAYQLQKRLDWNEQQYILLRQGLGNTNKKYVEISPQARVIIDRYLRSNGLNVSDVAYFADSDILIGLTIDGAFFSVVEEYDDYIVVEAKDGEGRRVDIRKDDIVLLDNDGNKKLFDLQSGDESGEQFDFSFVLDKSGSIDGYFDELKGIVERFSSSLPNGSRCAFVFFDEDFDQSEVDNYFDCGLVHSVGDGVEAGGATDIFSPLISVYQNIRNLERKGFVIIVSDGIGNAGNNRKEQALRAKEGIFTSIYWIGESDEKMIMEFGDFFFYKALNFENEFSKYLYELRAVVNNLSVIKIK